MPGFEAESDPFQSHPAMAAHEPENSSEPNQKVVLDALNDKHFGGR